MKSRHSTFCVSSSLGAPLEMPPAVISCSIYPRLADDRSIDIDESIVSSWDERVTYVSPPPAPPRSPAPWLPGFFRACTLKKVARGGACRGGAGVPHSRPLLPRVRQSPQHCGGEGLGGEQGPAQEGGRREHGGRDRRGDFPRRAAGRPAVRRGLTFEAARPPQDKTK